MVRSSVAAIYAFPEWAFYPFTRSGRRIRFLALRLLLCLRSEVEQIVHRMPEILFATEIAFRGLDRCVPQ